MCVCARARARVHVCVRPSTQLPRLVGRITPISLQGTSASSVCFYQSSVLSILVTPASVGCIGSCLGRPIPMYSVWCRPGVHWGVNSHGFASCVD